MKKLRTILALLLAAAALRLAAQPGLLLDDGKHPNPAGVKRMVKNILPTIETALKPPR